MGTLFEPLAFGLCAFIYLLVFRFDGMNLISFVVRVYFHSKVKFFFSLFEVVRCQSSSFVTSRQPRSVPSGRCQSTDWVYLVPHLMFAFEAVSGFEVWW